MVEGLRLKNRLAAGARPECPRINARSFISASCAVSETCTWSSSKETGGRSFHTLTEAGSMPGYQGVSKDRSAHQLRRPFTSEALNGWSETRNWQVHAVLYAMTQRAGS